MSTARSIDPGVEITPLRRACLALVAHKRVDPRVGALVFARVMPFNKAAMRCPVVTRPLCETSEAR